MADMGQNDEAEEAELRNLKRLKQRPGAEFNSESGDPDEWGGLPPGQRIPKGFETWSDYTRYALEGIQVHGPVGPGPDETKLSNNRPNSLVDRKRAMGIDFGPSFTGLALSLGGVNTIPMGTLRTGEDWKELAIKIAEMASTRRIKDIVVGQPLEKDGTEGRIGKLVRHFVKILADTCLLMLGGYVTVYLWDERFSTVYAAMRLTTRPKFDGAIFKTWLDGQRGLNFGAKGLLDAEAARAILEHWLAKDERSEVINKELSERVSPSREACTSYLNYRKVRASLPATRPTQPAGPGKDGWEWDDANPESYDMDADEYMGQRQDYDDYMKGMDRFGDRDYEYQKRRAEELKTKKTDRRIREMQDDSGLKDAFEAATSGSETTYTGLKLPKEKWNKYRN